MDDKEEVIDDSEDAADLSPLCEPVKKKIRHFLSRSVVYTDEKFTNLEIMCGLHCIIQKNSKKGSIFEKLNTVRRAFTSPRFPNPNTETNKHKNERSSLPFDSATVFCCFSGYVLVRRAQGNA